jgi:hypothetical protein
MSVSRGVKFLLPSIVLLFMSIEILAAQDTENKTDNEALPPLGLANEDAAEQNARNLQRQRVMPPAFAERAVVLDIVARIIEKGSDEVWNQMEQQVTIPGRPVGIKLVGENIVVSARFTPYFNKAGDGVIVAQGQIWIEVPGQGIHYQTTVQTIPLSFGEEVYFFPLGKNSNNENNTKDRIEIMVAANPYKETNETNENKEETSLPPADTIKSTNRRR